MLKEIKSTLIGRKINELTNQCIVALSSGGVQCRSIPLKTIKARFKSQILHSVLVLHNNYNNMAFAFGAIRGAGQDYG